MPTVADVALIWQQAGVSVIPIQANPTKRPTISWSTYMEHPATVEDVCEWWTIQPDTGLALICGHVSGGLEMCEIEGRALANQGDLLHIIMAMDDGGAGPIWDLLTGPEGYAEDSPSGGMHLLYRIADHPVPGNEKIARGEDRVVLAETRGEGGYVIVAPTGGHCHSSGQPWSLVNGNYGKLPVITWEERNLLHACLKMALDRTPIPVPVVTKALAFPDQYEHLAGELSPGDAFEAATDWSEILEPHGWRVTMSMTDGERHWVRPGKNARDGMSATTGRANDRDRLYVFSTSTIFESEVPYTKFGAYALLNFGGNHSAAAVALARKGFGGKRSIVDTTDIAEWVPPSDVKEYGQNDIGNGHRLADRVRGRYRYIWEEKQFYRWSGSVWIRDVDGGIAREWELATKDIDDDKWRDRCQSLAKFNAAVTFAKGNELTHSANDWAPERDLINCRNGVLNLKSGELSEHDPKHLMMYKFGTSFIPGATCARFEKFMADAVPNQEMRSYVQRALGYSLLGRPGARSIFLIFGPSGTGKSTLIETIQAVCGDYGATAGSGTFRQTTNNGPTPDLHALRGRRFVTTSETSETAAFDEDLLKRISGRDSISSRTLYGEPVEWTPECVLWVATNNPPKFNSDDNAIWRRTKLIPFTTVFQGPNEVEHYAQTHLIPEAPGILNWLLAGLQDYLAHGLQEPEEIEQLAQEQRRESDSVARFLADGEEGGLVVLGPQETIGCQQLYDRYTEWAAQVGERGRVNHRRFGLRLTSLQADVHKTGTSWVGITYRSRLMLSSPSFFSSD